MLSRIEGRVLCLLVCVVSVLNFVTMFQGCAPEYQAMNSMSNHYIICDGKKVFFCPTCRHILLDPETDTTDVNCLQEESKTLPPLPDDFDQQKQYLNEPTTPPTPPPPTEDQRKKMDSLRQQIEEQVNKVPAA